MGTGYDFPSNEAKTMFVMKLLRMILPLAGFEVEAPTVRLHVIDRVYVPDILD